jgi:putative transposase
MTDYRDNRVPGGTFFFTVRLLDRNSTLLTDHIAAFSEAIRQARIRKPFHADAWVVLPDHAHTIWTLPPGDHDCAARWRAVKIAFSKSLRKAMVADAPDGAIWEPHYLEHRIGTDEEYAALVDYMHANAVRHGLCANAVDWPWSSLHRFIAAGWGEPEPSPVLPPLSTLLRANAGH